MAKELSYQPLFNLGINGLNTQDNPATLDPSYLTLAENVVLRESGRIAFRKGFKQKVAPSGTAIGSVTEHNDSGTNKIFASHGTSIYTIDFTSPASAFPSSGADVKRTVANSTGDWQYVNFNKRLHCFHANIVPQRYDGALSSGSKWANFLDSSKPAGVTTFNPSCGMGYYGRIWCGGVAEGKDVLYYSTLLDGDDFRLTSANSSSNGGSISLRTVWGTDDIVAIAPFYGKLVIFGTNNIVIYDNPSIIGNLTLNEVIRGVGLVSRDSIQAIGDDLVFLSNTGLRSLARTTEKDKLPLTDLSLNVKDTLIRHIGQSSSVKSIYVENEGIYIMTFTASNITYVFDFKHSTPNGAPRITTWSFDNDREPASMAYTTLYGLLVGQKDGGLACYQDYFDTDLAGASTFTNSAYVANFATTWVNLGESVAASLLKRLFMVLEGGSGASLGLKWYKDFSPTPSKTTTITLNPVTTGNTSLWGGAGSLYGKSGVTYKPVFGLREYRTPLTGSAKNLKIAISITSNGFDASLQELTLLHKQGKIR